MTLYSSPHQDSLGNWLRRKLTGRKAKHKRPTRRPRGLESLEAREMLAGDVTVEVVKGKLKIAGDGQSNGVELTAGATSGSYVIRGIDNDGATTINGKESVTVKNVQKKVRFDMSGGDDIFQLRAASGDDLVLPQLLQVYGGTGNDRVSLIAEVGRIKIHDDIILELGAGDDMVDLLAKNSAKGIVAKQRLSVSMGSGNDSVMLDAMGGDARVKVKGNTLVQLDGGHDNSLMTAHDDNTRIQLYGALDIRGGDADDTIRLEALAENASVTVRGNIDITSGSGNDHVRFSADRHNALVALQSNVNISMASGADKLQLDATNGNARIAIDGALSAQGGSDDDSIRVQAKDGASSVSIAGTALLDAGSSSGLEGDAVTVRAMTGTAAVTFHGDTTILTSGSLRGNNQVALRADADDASLRFKKSLMIGLGNHNGTSMVEILARKGNALIETGKDLTITGEAGDSRILVESRFDNAAVRIGRQATVQTGRSHDEVEFLSGAGSTELTVGTDLEVRLGDGPDLLKLAGIDVAGSAILDGEVHIDTFIDGGGNTLGTLIVDFEL